MKPSRAKRRELARQRRYFAEDVEQPYTKDGKKNAKFERMYGKIKETKKIKRHYLHGRNELDI